jgi:hypothetical protein
LSLPSLFSFDLNPVPTTYCALCLLRLITFFNRSFVQLPPPAMSALAAYGRSARGLALCVLQGVRDSLRLDATLVFFLSSVTVRVRAAQCLLLNGLIFLGSIFLADYVWAPLLGKILELSGGSSGAMTASTGASIALPEESNLASWLHVLFLYAYQFLWLYPLYIISFILNTVWYQDIAGQAQDASATATAIVKWGVLQFLWLPPRAPLFCCFAQIMLSSRMAVWVRRPLRRAV